MAKVQRTKTEKEFRKAYKKAKNHLDGLGNGYGWAASEVLGELRPLLEKYIPDLDIDNVW